MVYLKKEKASALCRHFSLCKRNPGNVFPEQKAEP